MRTLLLCSVIALSACDWLTPPCTKLARAICDVGSEGDSCAFVLHVERGDDRGQAMCKELLPTAKDLAADPQLASARDAWRESRGRLGELGFTADPLKGRIETKLKEAGGVAGHLVDRLEKNSAEAERRTREGAENALDEAGK